MKYVIYLISLFILLQVPVAVANERYRVEVLVLKHLDHAERAREVKTLRDFSQATDFLTPLPEEPLPLCEPGIDEETDTESAGTAELPIQQETAQPGAVIEGEEEITESIEEEEVPVDPNAVLHIAEMGPEMQEAWRRLRLSGPFRPLQFLSWEQGSEEPFPALRIHDQAVVFTDDPWSDLRAENLAAEQELALVYGDAAPDPVADEEAVDCLEAYEEPLPDPTHYYGLDGTVSLVRTRFLHLHFDLQLREALPEPEYPPRSGALPALVPGAEPGFGTGAELPESGPPNFAAFDFRQNRQVRSGRMEYFDGPVIGVLAWITPIALEDTAER